MKPELGQRLFSLNVGNAARRREQTLKEVVVTKVGRTYFTVQNVDDNTGWSARQYYIDGWLEKTNYTPNSRLYISRSVWEDEKESAELVTQIFPYFEYGRNRKALSVHKLREIMAIITR